MHPTAMSNCKFFLDSYSSAYASQSKVKVIEIGSQDVNGSLRSLVPVDFDYVGVDFVSGKGVDVILDDPYYLPFDANSADIVISSSCFEHSQMFWLLFLEIMRILKPRGLFYLNAPSNGNFHRYPVDCWRFYPDSGGALVEWAKRNSINAVLLEAYTSAQVRDIWNDFVAIFLKDAAYVKDFPVRILDTKRDISNGVVHGREEFLNPSELPEDKKKLAIIGKIVSDQIKIA